MSNELLLTQFGQNAGLVREFYELYQTDPDLVPEEWRAFFGSLNGSLQVNGQVAYQVPASEAVPREAPASSLQAQVTLLIQAYRSLGHLRAHVSPVSRGIFRAPDPSDLETGGLSDHLSQSFDCSGLAGQATLPLSEIVSRLQTTYCSRIGFEYTHLTDPNERRWLQERIESQYPEASALTASDRALAVRKLIESDVLENELHKKFPGVFYFSGLGNEVIVPALEILANYAASKGITEGVIGIAHRARMIVNSCVLGKPIRNLLPEFEDNTPTTYMGFGDVKYHARSLGTKQTPSGREIKLQVLPNPSHLEAVNSVVEGVCRAKQDRLQEDKRYSILPILIHGDAAFVGQGSVWETLSMSQVDSAATQGTLHFVLNNQIGFTTNAADGRSSNYSTDMAKAVEAPVFHVNAEDVDAVCWVSKLALDFRNEFKRDVVVDLIGYRKFGHNESDDPSYTQPVLYSEIKEKKPLSENYQKFAIEAGAVTSEQAKSWRDAATQEFKDAQEPVNKPLVGPASPLHGKLSAKPSSTKVPREALERIADSLTNFPNDFHLHPKLKAQLEKRVQSVKDGDAIEWGVAEALAFGSLVMDGVGVRLCGQDCKRGTFSHRHLVLQDYQGGQDFSALSNLAQETSGVRFDIYNSILSEYACMGFEFGYAAEAQDKLVMWEGQFGDFANGAQIIIDQFIAASECKWQQLSGLVLLLPHGYEG
ncbi:MAG: 2-oxoglutarate dehydrogenase E1 component, partial [Proteobacteria bacterium]